MLPLPLPVQQESADARGQDEDNDEEANNRIAAAQMMKTARGLAFWSFLDR